VQNQEPEEVRDIKVSVIVQIYKKLLWKSKILAVQSEFYRIIDVA
jgi:hypothetical protein